MPLELSRRRRLGSSFLYTAVWAVGWMSLLLLASPAIALFVRHLIGSGVTLVSVHYIILGGHRGMAGVAGVVLLASGGCAYAVVLGRERPIA